MYDSNKNFTNNLANSNLIIDAFVETRYLRVSYGSNQYYQVRVQKFVQV